MVVCVLGRAKHNKVLLCSRYMMGIGCLAAVGIIMDVAATMTVAGKRYVGRY
jgi:hypothetical protein